MPLSDCEVRDPRIKRTRQLLQGALRSLLRTRSFEDLSIQDIADAATVNRATFYDHYNDKFALLEAMIASEFHRLLEERNVRFDGPCASAAAPLVLAVCDFIGGCSGQLGPGQTGGAFEPLVDAAMIKAIRRVLLEGLGRRPAGRPAHGLIAGAASWAIYGAVKEWSATRRRPAADKIVPAVVELVRPILAKAA